MTFFLADLKNYKIDYLRRRAIENAPLDNPESRNWTDVLGMTKSKLFPLVRDVLSEEKRLQFMLTYAEAVKTWKCGKCDSYDDRLLSKGMIECTMCNLWCGSSDSFTNLEIRIYDFFQWILFMISFLTGKLRKKNILGQTWAEKTLWKKLVK